MGSPDSTELRVEGTWRAFGAFRSAVLIELAYAQLNRKDDLLHLTAKRLAVVEEALGSDAASRPLDQKSKD